MTPEPASQSEECTCASRLASRPVRTDAGPAPRPVVVVDDPTQRAATERAAQVNRLIDDEPLGVHGTAGATGRLDRLCSALTRTLPATGVGVSLLTPDHNGGGIVAASDARSRVLEELQFTAGEGPCIDAYTTGRPVLVPDLDQGTAALARVRSGRP